jgi:ADP-ribose pyrophosphatase YjhB (NUDIX family)
MGVHDEWRHCPRCAAQLDRADGALQCSSCGSRYYANPAPTVTALVVGGDGRLLLARRAREPDAGAWDTLGGFLEEDEAPLDGLVRELAEETGLELESAEFVTATVDRYGDGPGAQSTLNLAYEVRVADGEPAPADDVAELRWFAAAELPPAEAFAFTRVGPLVHAWMAARTG